MDKKCPLVARHNLLSELFDTIDGLTFQNEKIKDKNYIVVGQLCIEKQFRGKGWANKIYSYYKENYCVNYDYAVTDISSNNPRSLKAHIKAGFVIIHRFKYEESSWDIVLLNLK